MRNGLFWRACVSSIGALQIDDALVRVRAARYLGRPGAK